MSTRDMNRRAWRNICIGLAVAAVLIHVSILAFGIRVLWLWEIGSLLFLAAIVLFVWWVGKK